MSVAAGLALAPTAPAAPSAEEQKLVTANTGFAFNLLREISTEQPGTNVFISPYSVSTVLEMVENGAMGRTKDELRHTLGLAHLGEELQNGAAYDLDRTVCAGASNATLTTANAVWCRKGVTPKADFITCNRVYYHATVQSLDFAAAAAPGIINAWAAGATHGTIPTIVSGPIDPATDMILASAVYFKAHWAKEFEPYLTKPKAFHLDATRTVTVPMMSVTHSWLYLRGDGFQAVQLPYKDSFLAMEVLLPDTNSSPEQLLTALDAKTWQKHIATGLVSKKGTILLPRFKLAQTTDLRQPLQTLGVHGAFDSSANFSALSDDSLYISRVLQKSYIQVDEAGTEAGAVTETWLTKGGDYDPEPFEMVMDLPFLFFITDTRSGTILFMGAIHDPSQAE
jgi:serpin B